MTEREKLMQKGFIAFVILVVLAMMAWKSVHAAEAQTESVFVHATSKELVILTQHGSGDEKVAAKGDDTVIGLIALGYKHVTALPFDTKRDVECYLDLHAGSDTISVGCRRGKAWPRSEGIFVLGGSNTFSLNAPEETFFSDVVKSLDTQRADMREILQKESK